MTRSIQNSIINTAINTDKRSYISEPSYEISQFSLNDSAGELKCVSNGKDFLNRKRAAIRNYQEDINKSLIKIETPKKI